MMMVQYPTQLHLMDPDEVSVGFIEEQEEQEEERTEEKIINEGMISPCQGMSHD